MISGLNVNKANILHTYTLIFIVVGIEQVVDFFKSNKALKYGIIGCLAISFCWFSSYYFGAYNQEISDDFKQGLGEAVSCVHTLDAHEVYVDPSIYHSQILFYDQTPLPEYLETVSYKNYPSAYLQAAGFSKYNFNVDYATLDAGAVYISPLQNKSFFAENGFIVQEFDRYIVAYI